MVVLREVGVVVLLVVRSSAAVEGGWCLCCNVSCGGVCASSCVVVDGVCIVECGMALLGMVGEGGYGVGVGVWIVAIAVGMILGSGVVVCVILAIFGVGGLTGGIVVGVVGGVLCFRLP
jgi:hypothetical protein